MALAAARWRALQRHVERLLLDPRRLRSEAQFLERLHTDADLVRGLADRIYDFGVDIEELRRYRRNAIWGAPHRQVAAYADLVADGFGKDFLPDQIIS